MTEPLSPPATLSHFQASYADHLRNPGRQKKPNGVPARADAIYKNLLFNNVCGFIDKCFPVARSITSPERWKRLCRQFFRDYQALSPYFNHIPEEFVQYVNHIDGQTDKSRKPFAKWFPELIHYEWVELAVNTAPDHVPKNRGYLDDDSQLSINPTAFNLHYEWPVQLISGHFKPRNKQNYFVLIFRDAHYVTKFVATNQMTFMLLSLLAENPGVTANDLLASLNTLIQHPDTDQFMQFGKQMIHQLVEQHIILFSE